MPFIRSYWQGGRGDTITLTERKQRNINNLKAIAARYRIRIYYHLQSADTLLLTVYFIILELRADLCCASLS